MIFSLAIIKKFFPIFTSFLIFLFSLLSIFLFSYSLFLFFLFSFLAIFSSFFFLLLLLEKEIKKFWQYSINFFLLIFGNIFFLIFTKDQVFKIVFIFLVSALSSLFLKTVFRFLYEPRKYPAYSLENISFSFSLIAVFFFLSGLSALGTFLDFPIIYSLIFVFLISFWSIYFIFWTTKLPQELSIHFIVSLIISELFYSFKFLPTSFYINGLVLTILFFLIISLIKKEKEGLLTQEIIKKYLILSFSVLILILILAKWR